MRVSVAMATYNGAKFLVEQLESIRLQSRLPDELVVSDDNSTDGTIQILEDYAKDAPFEVRILRNLKNVGYVKNFERSLSGCVGDIIFLCDQDDYWLPEKIERQSTFLENSNKRFTVCDILLCGPNLEKGSRTQLGNILAAGRDDSAYWTGCAAAFHRDLLDLALPFPDDLTAGHDAWLGRLADALRSKAILPEVLQYYRRHDNNESRWLLSEDRKIGIYDIVSTYGLNPALEGWGKEVARLNRLRNRIVDKPAAAEKVGGRSAVAAAKASIDRRISVTKNRINLMGYSRAVRWTVIGATYLRGGYKDFSGWKSALKDAIRP